MNNLDILIEAITPLYNSYRQKKEILSGTEALGIMWDIGEVLKQYIEENKIAPHRLYRQIYGKGEGTENVAQKSYITREFLGRCYRIQNIFQEKKGIVEQLPNLKRFTSFREAMPFFDHTKYKLDEESKNNLLKLLNSNLPSGEIVDNLENFKEKVGLDIKNPRTQKLSLLQKEKRIFIDFYNHVLLILREEEKVGQEVKSVYVRSLSRNTGTLAKDDLTFLEMEKVPLPKIWNDYYELIRDFIEQSTPQKIRQFRRIIPPERMLKLSDMLFQLYEKINK